MKLKESRTGVLDRFLSDEYPNQNRVKFMLMWMGENRGLILKILGRRYNLTNYTIACDDLIGDGTIKKTTESSLLDITWNSFAFTRDSDHGVDNRNDREKMGAQIQECINKHFLGT